MTPKHKFQPRWDEQERGYYCLVCGVLKQEHAIFDEDGQNAAESLPVRQARIICDDTGCGEWNCDDCHPETKFPVAPVETKPFYENSECADCNGKLYGKKAFWVPTTGKTPVKKLVCEKCATVTEPKKLKIGQKVLAPPMDGEGQRRMLTVAGRETHNHREFYRVDEIPGALFLSKSLMRVEFPQPDSIDLKPWLDQAVDLLNLYHSGYCPKDVAKDFLEKCRTNFNNVAEYKPFVDSPSVPSGESL